MINNTTSNTKLSVEQLLAIEETENRLSSLESLISISNKNLKTAKINLDNTIKDNELGQEKLKVLNIQIKELSEIVSSLESTKESKIKEVNDSSAMLDTIKSNSASIIAEHNQREVVISEKESELAIRETNIIGKEKEIEESKRVLGEKHDRIKEFVAKI